LTQIIPKSFYAHQNDICLGYKSVTEGYFRSYLKNTEKHKYQITPFSYQNSFSSTKEFQEWWEWHYSASIPSEGVLLTQISSGFESLGFESGQKWQKVIFFNVHNNISFIFMLFVVN
jgi:hypothetical protein